MSSNQGYQQSEAIAARLDSQLEGMADKPAGKLQAAYNNYNSQSAVGVPGYYHSQDSAADTRMAYRAAAAGANTPTSDPMISGLDKSEVAALENFKVSLTQQDIDFFEKRRQEKLQIEFDEWVTHAIDVADPGEARWLQQMYPQFWERREKFLDDKINVEARAAKIRLRGIKSVEDMKFLFAVSKGYITLPDAPAFSSNPGGSNYVKGFFRRIGHPLAPGQIANRPLPAAFSPQLGAGSVFVSRGNGFQNPSAGFV